NRPLRTNLISSSPPGRLGSTSFHAPSTGFGLSSPERTTRAGRMVRASAVRAIRPGPAVRKVRVMAGAAYQVRGAYRRAPEVVHHESGRIKNSDRSEALTE